MTRLLNYHKRDGILAGATGREFFATNKRGFVRLSIPAMHDLVYASYGCNFTRLVDSIGTPWRGHEKGMA